MIPTTTIDKPFTAFDANQAAKIADIAGSETANRVVDHLNKEIKSIVSKGGFKLCYHFDHDEREALSAVASYYRKQHYDVTTTTTGFIQIEIDWSNPKTDSEKDEIEILKAIHNL